MSAREILLLATRSTLVTGMLAAAAADLRWRIVPDTAVLAVAFGGGLARLLSGGAMAAGLGLAAALALFLLLSALWRFGVLGGGDVKLIAAAALGEPLARLFALLTSIALAGGVLAGLLLLGRWFFGRRLFGRRLFGRLGEVSSDRNGAPSRLRRLIGKEGMRGCAGTPIPYAPAVLIGWAWTGIRCGIR